MTRAPCRFGGTVVQIFDTKKTALTLLKHMRTIGKTWNCYASEDVICVAVSYHKPVSYTHLTLPTNREV